jgi:SPP1 family predicted phage head-tail adaptor
MLQAGKLRHKIALLSPLRTATAEGDWTITFTQVAVVWALIQPATGHKGYIAQQVRPDVTHLITIRRHPGLTPDYRGLYDGRTFDFGPPMEEDEARVKVTFYAVELTRTSD